MKRPLAGSLFTSITLHASALAVGAWLLSRSFSPNPARPPSVLHDVDVTVAHVPGVDLPSMSRTGIRGAPDHKTVPQPELVTAGGGEHEPRPDLRRAGRGGDSRSAQAALNLADSDDGLTLDRDQMNRLDQSQVQRLATERDRRSRDDRRATPNPMELSFLATGDGRLAERRPNARANPSNGSFSASAPAAIGSELGGPPVEPGRGPEPSSGGSVAGSDRSRPGPGVASGARGSDFRFSAAVALARPAVPRSRAAVPAPRLGRPNDNVESSQDVASAVASLVHASTAGANRRAAGPGGEAGGGQAASGGAFGPGSRATPSGSGPGAMRDAGGDARLGAYFASIKNRLGRWENAFPRWAISEGRGGLTTLGFTILADGNVIDVRVVRSSGIEEFDRNLIAHLKRSLPFDPPPAFLGRRVPLNFTFDAMNPAVGRDGPGRGRASPR
jgi:TonB family protein